MGIPHIKNAYENVKEACEKRLAELYPAGIPNLVKERYEKELGYLEHSESQDDFEIFRLLREEGNRTSQYIFLRGTISSSFLVYLLDCSGPNPLPPHYYCKKCGHMEMVDTPLFGIDLPEIKCPVCGESLTGDGFHLHEEFVWGIDGKREAYFNYGISSDFLPFAKRVLEKLYPENSVVSYGNERMFNVIIGEIGDKLGVVHSGYVILPEGREMEDYPEVMTYLENGEPCLSASSIYLVNDCGAKIIKLTPTVGIEKMMELQKKSGLYACEIGIQELKRFTYYDLINSKELLPMENNVFIHESPKSYYAMSNFCAAVYNSYADVDVDRYSEIDIWELKEKVLDKQEFQRYACYTREGFYETLMECGLERKEAFQTSELIRKGKARREPEFEKLLIPEELKNIAKMSLYVFPRSLMIEYLLLAARLTYYMKWNSRIYSSVIRKKW